eukprot:GHUV01023801.1.p1 GENE.GHUV01023801.1~~GHUV01023801.1.p1  ORF type:complete len:135 (+),score=20.11 GHUV01023801.1:47-451(+)
MPSCSSPLQAQVHLAQPAQPAVLETQPNQCGMDLRSGARTGPIAQLSPEAKAGFEEGVGLIFSQWTALVLAVENQWGGPDSATKADYFIEDIIEWFYKKKEHYVDDLEMELADTLLEDFQVEAEDGSPAQPSLL